MIDDSQYNKFLETLKGQGMGEEEIKKMLAGLTEVAGSMAYMALMSGLTDEDKRLVEAIEDDEEAKKEMEKLFVLRTGKSVDQYLREIRDKFSQGYVKGLEKSRDAGN